MFDDTVYIGKHEFQKSKFIFMKRFPEIFEKYNRRKRLDIG
jgi:hypothetical protein